MFHVYRVNRRAEPSLWGGATLYTTRYTRPPQGIGINIQGRGACVAIGYCSRSACQSVMRQVAS